MGHTIYENILKAIRALASGDQPDIDISDLLYQHGCYYLLSQLKQPHKYIQTLTRESLFNRICINERYRNCREIFSLFDSKDIPYAVIKGAILSVSAFGDPYCRHSGDIDLLINRQNIDIVKQILLAHGFLQGRITEDGIQPFTRRELLFQSTTSHQTAPFVKSTASKICPYINVDVNMDIMWGESKQKSDMNFVLNQTMQTDICGITTRKLPSEMEFITLCLHHYKDMNSIYLLSHGSLKLNLLCDIYYYIKNVQLQADKLFALCQKMNVSEYVYYCLYYADQIFDDTLLKAHYTALYSTRAAYLLNCFGLNENEIHMWDIDFFERLFHTDIHEYFQKILSSEMLDKIKINEVNM